MIRNLAYTVFHLKKAIEMFAKFRICQRQGCLSEWAETNEHPISYKELNIAVMAVGL